MGSGSDSLSYALLASQLMQSMGKQPQTQPGAPAPSAVPMGGDGMASQIFGHAGTAPSGGTGSMAMEALIQELVRKKMGGEFGVGGTPMLARGGGPGAATGFPGMSGGIS